MPQDLQTLNNLKNVVCKTRSGNIKELETRIGKECHNIPQESVSNIQKEFINRIKYYKGQEGLEFGHLISLFNLIN